MTPVPLPHSAVLHVTGWDTPKDANRDTLAALIGSRHGTVNKAT
ncbi:hypothetical protein [Deinococcus enclensis]|uniref:Uncharacterized protein n=1 Tax=Deinococcus enclensis TaxID=1049582 RepID=A0ABT9MG37_9DEIO|nr:hypothetical protein [Deinococcus enclensis]MDP9765560.1 hypothetical protein [Deinococcus enclensis]